MNGTCETCGRPRLGGSARCAACAATTAAIGGEDLDHTVVRPQSLGRQAQSVLVVDDGTQIPIDGSLLLGRAPRKEMGSASVVLPDEGMTVSKTHVRIAVCADGVAVTDLRSTNGVRVILPGGQDYWLEPGEPEVLAAGTRVHLGARSFTVADFDGVWSAPETGGDGGTMVPIVDWPVVSGPEFLPGRNVSVGPLTNQTQATTPADGGGLAEAAPTAVGPDAAQPRRRTTVPALLLAMAGCLGLLTRDPVIAVVGVLCIGASIHLFRGGRMKSPIT